MASIFINFAHLKFSEKVVIGENIGIADIIKGQIKRLYETNPDIHINVRIIRPRVMKPPRKSLVFIKTSFRLKKTATDGSTDTPSVIGQVVIKELDYAPVNR